MMNTISDEMIMAFVDGELDDEQEEKVHQALDTHPELLEKVAMFQETQAMLQGMYDEPLQTSVPEHLVRTVEEFEVKQGLQPLHAIKEFFIWISGCFQLQPMPVFALLAILVLSGGLYYQFKDISPAGSDYPALVQSDSFSQGLESTLSGTLFTASGFSAEVVMPVLSFTDTKNRFCRQYDIMNAENKTGITGQGIACQVHDGEWQTVIFEKNQAEKRSVLSKNSFELASAENTVEQMLNDTARQVLSDKQEQKLILNGWSSNTQ